MLFVHAVMAVCGLLLISWGLPASHRLKSPVDVVAALAVLLGVVAALLGTLLIVAPGFFRG